MIAWIQESGGFKPCDSIPLSDRGFRYGMSVFETVMLRNGLPVFLREHLLRLAQACEKCSFHTPPLQLDPLAELLKNSVPDGLARICVTAGDGTVSSPAEECRVFIFVEPRTPIAPAVYRQGYHLAVSKEIHHPMFGGLKTGNYWSNLVALNQGKNETLLFNAQGELISSCMANVFVVHGSELLTPALSCGARNGVIREWVLGRRKATEGSLTRDDLSKADALFLTSSWLGVMPATALEERSLPVPAIASELLQEFSEKA